MSRVSNGERLKLAENNIFNELIIKSWNPTPPLRPEFSDILIMLNNLKSRYGDPKINSNGPLTNPPNMPTLSSSSPFTTQQFVPASPSPSPYSARKGNDEKFLNARHSMDIKPSAYQNVSDFKEPPRPQQNTQQTPKQSSQQTSPQAQREVVGPTDYKLYSTPFEELLLSIFERKPSVSWDDFTAHINNVVDANVAYKLQYLIANVEGGFVPKEEVVKLVNWMSVLKPKADKNKRFIWKTIIDIIEAGYFHGWMNPNQAKAALSTSAEGTFLLRFSSKPGSFALSVAHAKDVYHCRIDCTLTNPNGIYLDTGLYHTVDKSDDSEVVSYQIHNKHYASMTDILQTHMKVPLGVIESSDAVLLKDPILRRNNMYCLVPNSN